MTDDTSSWRNPVWTDEAIAAEMRCIILHNARPKMQDANPDALMGHQTPITTPE